MSDQSDCKSGKNHSKPTGFFRVYLKVFFLFFFFLKLSRALGNNAEWYLGTVAGWMIFDFTSFLTVFQSYQDYGG